VTFDIGTDIDKAQVLVQNRIAVAEPRLPEPRPIEKAESDRPLPAEPSREPTARCPDEKPPAEGSPERLSGS